MAAESHVEEVVRSAWERRFLVTLVERGGVAAAVVLGSFVLLLILGSQVLSGYWLALLAAGGLAITGYQVHRRMLDNYRVAQILDRRLQLADALSTAWYLLSDAKLRRHPAAEIQLEGADRAARNVNVAGAFPFTGGRAWWISGGLLILALGMFSVRYLVTQSFSLQPSILPFSLTEVFERTGKEETAQAEKRPETPGADQRGEKTQAKADARKDGKDQPRESEPHNPPAQADGSNSGQNARDQQQQPGDKPEGKSGSAQQKQGENAGEKGEESAASDKKPSSDDKANSPQSSNGLVDRMKDALTSLASKMKPGEGEQQKGNQQKGDQQSEANKDRRDSQTSPSEQSASAQGQPQSQTQEKTRSGQGKSSEPFGDKSKPDSHSGVGSQDGDKALKDAEQSKAMGKLAEIIGKRSEDATGEMMVENPSGKQRLQTAYSQRMGQHADLGGEINRDEVPPAYRQYVREYLSQVRNQARRHSRKHR